MTVHKNFWSVLAVLVTATIWLIIHPTGPANRIVYFCVLLIVVALVWSFGSVRGFTIRRYTRGLRRQLGQVLVEQFEIKNVFPFLRLWLCVRDDTNLPGSGGSRVLSWIGGRELVSYPSYTLLIQRGNFILGPTVIYSGDPFGLFTTERRILAESSILVTPFMVDLQQFPFTPGFLQGGRTIRRKSIDITPRAAGVREYVPGDALKRIHWPSTAKRDRLMVKEFELDPQSDVWIFLDADTSVQSGRPISHNELLQSKVWLYGQKVKVTLPAITFEYSVSAASSITNYFFLQRQAVGLVCAGQTMVVLPAERDERQLSKILETLSFIECQGTMSLPVLVEAQASHLSRGSTVILISPAHHDQLLLAVDNLLYRDLRPVVVLIERGSFGGRPMSDETMEALILRGVPAVIVREGDDLKESLESAVWSKNHYSAMTAKSSNWAL